MLIKVCGMREPDNIRQVEELGIDWMGFIFYAQSPRCIKDEASTGKQTKRVGVFVNASVEEMMQQASSHHLDYLQLHGNESPDTCYALQKRGYSVIKAFSIATEEDLVETTTYEGRADYFLFDTKCSGYGGSGKSFDWSVLAAYQGKTPFLLSGGINPDSTEAVRNFHHPRLAGIDLNSGFEVSPGLKEIGKLAVFINKLRNI